MRLFDLHADTLTVCENNQDSLYKNSCHFDIQRASRLELFRQILAVFVSDETKEEEAWPYTLRCLTYLFDQVGEDTVGVSTKHLCQTNKAVCIPAVENGKAIGADLNRITVLSSYGIVYMTLTWNGSNRLGNGCMSDDKRGLSMFGKQAVAELYRSHIVPDVSHLNEAGFWDVCEIAEGRPFIASHSVSSVVHRHPRNLSDAQYDAIRQHGGLVGINLCEAHLGEQSFDGIRRHLEHFLERDGMFVTALGFDLDGTDIPREWEGIAVASKFYDWLLSKGYSEAVLERVFFENSQAFFMKSLTTKEECTRIGM